MPAEAHPGTSGKILRQDALPSLRVSFPRAAEESDITHPRGIGFCIAREIGKILESLCERHGVELVDAGVGT